MKKSLTAKVITLSTGVAVVLGTSLIGVTSANAATVPCTSDASGTTCTVTIPSLQSLETQLAAALPQLSAAQIEALAQQLETDLQNGLNPAVVQAIVSNIATAVQNGLDPQQFIDSVNELVADLPTLDLNVTVDLDQLTQAIESIAQGALNPAQVQAIVDQVTTALQNVKLPVDPQTVIAAIQSVALQGAAETQAAVQQVVDAVKSGLDPATLSAELAALQQQLKNAGLTAAQIQAAVQNAIAQLAGKVDASQLLPTVITGLEQALTQASGATNLNLAALNQTLDTLIPALTGLSDSLTAPGAPTAGLAPVLNPIFGFLGL